MNAISPSKMQCNVKFGAILGCGDSDGEEDGDDAGTAATCDYVVALESDNTIEIISSEDGLLINVRRCCHGGGA